MLGELEQYLDIILRSGGKSSTLTPLFSSLESRRAGAEVAGAGWLWSVAAADEAAALGSRGTPDSTEVGNGGTLLLAVSTGVLLGASSNGAAFARRWARSETCEPTAELRPTSLEGVVRGERCLRVLSRGVRSPAGYAEFSKVAAATTKELQVLLPSPA